MVRILIFIWISGLYSLINLASINLARPAFNVRKFGAVGGGTTDASSAFLKTWEAACAATESNPTIVVPRGSFLVYPAVFKGPCKSSITFRLKGEIIAPAKPSAWKGLDQGQWMEFTTLPSGLSFTGTGIVNGSGKGWWDQNCRDHPTLAGCTTLAPTALRFTSINGLTIKDVHVVESPQSHVLVMMCNSVNVDNFKTSSPEQSPNTDGLHLQSVQNVTITNSQFACGDDCVSIGDFTSNVIIKHVECGPGHGISIGSLGRDGNVVNVHDINVNDVTFTGTTNGARIKTWQVGKGTVQRVTFENLKFNSVQNPIIIDQNYCDRSTCSEMQTGVHIHDVTFKGMVGTSSTQAAITLNCSKAVPCTGIVLDSIQLTSNVTGQTLTTDCSSAQGITTRSVQPSLSCLVN